MLGEPRPNPSARGGILPYALPRAGRVRLTIVDAGGRAVARLLDARGSAGRTSLTWDGRDSAGRRMPSGVYFALLDLDDGRVVHLKFYGRDHSSGDVVACLPLGTD